MHDNGDRQRSATRDTDPTERYFAAERTASKIESYGSVIPGLLQTRGYADAVLGLWNADPAERDRKVAVRQERQQILDRERPPAFVAFLEESVLYRPIGGAEVARQQLAALLEAMRAGRVSVSVLPLSGKPHKAIDSNFIRLTPAGSETPDLVYVEGANGTRCIEGRDEYDEVFDSLRQSAVTGDGAVELVEAAMARLG